MSRIYYYNKHELESPGIYLAFDQFGDVLYIGSSKEPWARIGRHRSNAMTKSPWWLFMESIEVRTQPSLEIARRVEGRWISMVCPPFNDQHRPRFRGGHPFARTGPLPLVLEERVLRPSDLTKLNDIAERKRLTVERRSVTTYTADGLVFKEEVQ